MEDMSHMKFFQEVEQELTAVIVGYNRKTFGITDMDKLIALRTEQAELLMDLIKKHRRTMDYMQGKPVEPVTHFGEAVLLPVGGLAP
jgi:hypothetical protein